MKVSCINNKLVSNLIFGIILIFYIFNSFDSNNNRYQLKYALTPDSKGYILANISSDPWSSMRSPLYPLLCGLFFSEEEKKILIECVKGFSYKELWDRRNGKIEKIIFENGINKSFERIVFFQRVILSLSMVLLFYSLSQFFSSIIAFFAIIISVNILPLTNVYAIMTEPIFQSLIVMTLSCICLYKSYHLTSIYIMASIFALLAFLTRPAGIFLILICIYYLIYFIYTDNFRSLKKYFLPSAILSLSFIYILYISVPIGSIVFGTMTERSKNGFSLFFLEQSDVDNMPTRRSKVFASTFLENKNNFRRDIQNVYEHSLPGKTSCSVNPRKYAGVLNAYINLGVNSTLKALESDKEFRQLDLKERAKLSLELEKGVMERHKGDILLLKLHMFLSGIGIYNDFNPSFLSNKYGMLYLFGIICTVIALVIYPPCRFVILLLCSTHILHIATCAYGHIVLGRFTNITELLVLIAIFLSVWVLSMKGISLFISTVINVRNRTHPRLR